MKIIKNPHQNQGLKIAELQNIPELSTDFKTPLTLIQKCPEYSATELRQCPELAENLNIKSLAIKDESTRMGLGHFKALGAAYVIAEMAQNESLKGKSFICASAGNHGASLAIGAKTFGARAIILLDENVPEIFAQRLEAQGAQVMRVKGDYETACEMAKTRAANEGHELISDSSWQGYTQAPHKLMEGYLVLMAEIQSQIQTPPSHIFLQAGVGGLAASSAALARQFWPETIITIVEPEKAPALYETIKTGEIKAAGQGISNMGRLDCKEPSLIALKSLAKTADYFMTISDEDAADAINELKDYKIQTTPSGGAGLAALLKLKNNAATLNLDSHSTVLAIMSEGAI